MNALLSRKFYVTPSTCNSVFISLPLHSRWVYLKHSNLSVRIRESVRRIAFSFMSCFVFLFFYLQWTWPKGGVKHLYRWLQVAPSRPTTYLFTSLQNSEFYCCYLSPSPSGCIYVSRNILQVHFINTLKREVCHVRLLPQYRRLSLLALTSTLLQFRMVLITKNISRKNFNSSFL